MLLKAISYPHLPQDGSPYCSDPNCVYCIALRKTHEKLKTTQRVLSSGKTFHN
jgi:hypothetical protein